MYKMMSPGPTKVAKNVRMARAQEAPNPDLDANFVELYKTVCDKIGRILGASGAVYLLSGEAILGLEAACASLTQPGSRVLVLANGIYGQYFADFVKIYGGTAVVANFNWQHGISPKALQAYLEKDHDFTYATLVHCDTPSGVLNSIEALCPLLHEYGILSVVDAVSSSFAAPLNIATSHIDVLCSGSQKALSAPAGITILCVSLAALSYMNARDKPIASYYGNILNYENYYSEKWFPYTMPASDILGIEQAVLNLEKDVLHEERHRQMALALRRVLISAGLTLYLDADFSPTVTAICVPQGFSATEITSRMLQEHGILIAGSIDVLKDKLIRIGHMGENANEEDLAETLTALACVLGLKENLGDAFKKEWRQLKAE